MINRLSHLPFIYIYIVIGSPRQILAVRQAEQAETQAQETTIQKRRQLDMTLLDGRFFLISLLLGEAERLYSILEVLRLRRGSCQASETWCLCVIARTVSISRFLYNIF